MQRAAAVLAVLALATPLAGAPPAPGALHDRTELADAGDRDLPTRVRVALIADQQLVDDDAPFPLRHEYADHLGGPFSPAHRPQEEHGDEILDSTVRRINALHRRERIDLALSLADNVDNSLENELMRFLDVLEGTSTREGPISGLACVPDGQSTAPGDDRHDRTDRCTSLPPGLAGNTTGLADDLPWYTAFGNHDGLIQGNSPREPGYQREARRHGRYFLSQAETVRMHFDGQQACRDGEPAGGPGDDHGHGYGFAGPRLCNADPDDDAYYAFTRGGVRFVVLDTHNDDWVAASDRAGTPDRLGGAASDKVGGYAAGAIDPDQYAWLIRQIESHPDQLIVLASHHTPVSWWSRPRNGSCWPCREAMHRAGYRTGREVARTVAGYDRVVAWLGGHTHRHRVQVLPPRSEGFWSIETASLIDAPQEARMLEIHVGEDRGYLATWPVDHGFEEGRRLAENDSQADPTAAGRPIDRAVRLWFEVPDQVALAEADAEPGAALPGLGVAGIVAALVLALRWRRRRD